MYIPIIELRSRKLDLPKIHSYRRSGELSKIRHSIKMQEEPKQEESVTKRYRILSESKNAIDDESFEKIFPDILTSNRKLHRNIDIGKFKGRDELFGKTPDCIPDYNPDHNIRFKHPQVAIRNLYLLDLDPLQEKSRNSIKALMRNTSHNLHTGKSYKNFFDINDIISKKKDDREREVIDEQDLKMINQQLHS